MKNRITFQEQVRNYAIGELFYGDFLDFMYRLTGEEMIDYFSEEPDWCGLKELTCSYIVASIEHIMACKGVENFPEWLFSSKFTLKEPHFACKKGSNLMVILLIESPYSFKRRGVFVSENTIDRV